MKKLSIIIFSFALLTACGGDKASENNNAVKNDKKEDPAKKETREKEAKEDDGLSGEYTIKVGNDTYTGDNYKKGNTDFTYLYQGDESHVTVRIRNEETDDNILFSVYGSEEVIDNPEGTYETMMVSGGDSKEKVNLVFMVDSMDNPIYGSINMMKGKVTVKEMSDEGTLKLTFQGKGGNTKAFQDSGKMVPFSGQISVGTPSVMKMGKDKKK